MIQTRVEMKFSEVIENAAYRSDCSHLFVHFDRAVHTAAVIEARIRKLGGEITGVELLPSEAPHCCIAHISLANEDVRDMVIELSENELVDAQGLNRRPSGAPESAAPQGRRIVSPQTTPLNKEER